MQKAVPGRPGEEAANEAVSDKGTDMNDFLVLIAIIVAWFVLNKYVLPRFGVKT